MKFMVLFFGLLAGLVLGLPVKMRDDEPSPGQPHHDVTAIEYGRLAAKTIKARVVPSSDATAIEYGLVAASRTSHGPQDAKRMSFAGEEFGPGYDGGKIKSRDDGVIHREDVAERDNGVINSDKPRTDDVVRLQVVSDPDSEWTKRDVKYPILNKRPIVIAGEGNKQSPDTVEVSDATAIEYGKTKPRQDLVEYSQHLRRRSPIGSRAVIEPNNILGPRSHITVNREMLHREPEAGAATPDVSHMPGIVKRPTAVEYAKVKAREDEGADTTGWTRKKLKARQDEPDATAIEYALDATPDTTGWGKNKVKGRQEEPDATMVEYALESTPDSGSWGRAQRRQDGTVHGDAKSTDCSSCHGVN